MNTLFVLLQAAGQGSSLIGMLPWVAILLVMYLFMIRPQMKKAKAAKKFREALAKGDRVVTIGGIHGKILEVHETTVLLDTMGGGKLRMEKSALSADMTSHDRDIEGKRSN